MSYKMLKTLALFSVLVIGATGFAQSAHANATDIPGPTSDCSQPPARDPINGGTTGMGAFNSDLYENGIHVSGTKLQVRMAAIRSVPPLDLDLAYCLTTLENAFDMIAAFNDTASVVGAMAYAVMSSLQSQINALCSNVATYVSSVESSAISRANFCVPTPNVKLGLGTLTPMTNKPCNGAPLVGLHQVPLSSVPTGSTPIQYKPAWGFNY